MPPDVGGFNSEFNDILRDIDDIIGPDRPDDHSEDQDISTWDKQPSPIVSPIVESREEAKQVVQPRATPSPLPPIPPPPSPPQERPVAPRTKRKSVMSRAWSNLRKLLMKKFGGDHPPPKLSDRLAPEREEEARRYETLFVKTPQPTKTRRKA